jgi:hypothetical protein
MEEGKRWEREEMGEGKRQESGRDGKWEKSGEEETVERKRQERGRDVSKIRDERVGA